MTTTDPARQAISGHPFSTGIARRDLHAVVESLAPDAVLYSAVAGAPFEGKEVLADLYASVLESFEELRVVEEFQNGDTHAFFWEGRMGGRYVAGADRFRVDADDRVVEITILARPLSGLSTFLTEIGFRFARRRRGRPVALLLRLSALPLPPLFSLLDPVVRWLQRRS